MRFSKFSQREIIPHETRVRDASGDFTSTLEFLRPHDFVV